MLSRDDRCEWRRERNMDAVKEILRKLVLGVSLLGAIVLGMGILVGSYYVLIEVAVWVWGLI